MAWESFNDEQLEYLAKLSFDLSKAAFIMAVFSPVSQPDWRMVLFRTLTGVVFGVILMYGGLEFLNLKRKH